MSAKMHNLVNLVSLEWSICVASRLIELSLVSPVSGYDTQPPNSPSQTDMVDISLIMLPDLSVISFGAPQGWSQTMWIVKH